LADSSYGVNFSGVALSGWIYPKFSLKEAAQITLVENLMNVSEYMKLNDILNGSNEVKINLNPYSM
jgi:hypothetical protein